MKKDMVQKAKDAAIFASTKTTLKLCGGIIPAGLTVSVSFGTKKGFGVLRGPGTIKIMLGLAAITVYTYDIETAIHYYRLSEDMKLEFLQAQMNADAESRLKSMLEFALARAKAKPATPNPNPTASKKGKSTQKTPRERVIRDEFGQVAKIIRRPR